MLRSLVVSTASIENGEIALRRNLSPENLQEALADGHKIWIDVTDPDDEEIAWLETTLKLHPAVVNDLKREDRRPALMVYPDYLFLSLFEPQMKLKEVRGAEIHCLISTNYFVTVREANTRVVDNAYERAAQNPESFRRGTAYMLYLTTQFVVDAYYPLLDQISLQLSQLEEVILTEGKSISEHAIYRIKQQLISLRQMVAPQREVLSGVIGEDRLAETTETRDLFRHLYERLLRVYDVIDSQRDLSSNVLDLMRNQASNRLAEAVNRLTLLSMIFLPLTFIIGLFGLNFVTTQPEMQIPIDGGWMFTLIVVLTGASGSWLLWFFRRKGWL
jgi:magnesium transporter